MLSAGRKMPATTRRSPPLAQSALSYFAQQKIAKYADPLRRAQLLRVDEIGLIRRPGQLREDAHQARILGRDKIGQRGEAEATIHRPQLAVGVVDGEDRTAVAPRLGAGIEQPV